MVAGYGNGGRHAVVVRNGNGNTVWYNNVFEARFNEKSAGVWYSSLIQDWFSFIEVS